MASRGFSYSDNSSLESILAGLVAYKCSSVHSWNKTGKSFSYIYTIYLGEKKGMCTKYMQYEEWCECFMVCSTEIRQAPETKRKYKYWANGKVGSSSVKMRWKINN